MMTKEANGSARGMWRRVAAACTAATLAFGLSAGESRAIEMVMTNELATTHWSAVAMDRFAAEIEARTEGRITPRVYHSGSLFSDREAVAALGTGAVHMIWPVSVQLESVAPEYGVINLPMAFDDTLMLREGAPQALAEYLSQFVADRGMQVMGLMRTADPIFIFRDRYIETPEAMNNTKIRVTGGRILQELIRGLGASPITMPATEMATALMQGTIDGILTSYGGWEMVGTNAAPRATWIPGLSLLTYTVLVDRDWLAGLPEDLREIVIDTTEEMLATQWRDGIAADVAKRDEMLAMGGTLHEVDSAAREEFRARALEANQIFTDQYPEVWAGFQEVLNRFGE